MKKFTVEIKVDDEFFRRLIVCVNDLPSIEQMVHTYKFIIHAFNLMYKKFKNSN